MDRQNRRFHRRFRSVSSRGENKNKTRTKTRKKEIKEKEKKIQINEQLTRVLKTLDIFGHQINPLRIDYLAFICFPFN